MVVQNIQLPKGLRSIFHAPYTSVSNGLIELFVQILDELIIAGELQESSKKSVLRVVSWKG